MLISRAAQHPGGFYQGCFVKALLSELLLSEYGDVNLSSIQHSCKTQQKYEK